MKSNLFLVLVLCMCLACEKESVDTVDSYPNSNPDPGPIPVVDNNDVIYNDVSCASCDFIVQDNAWQVDGAVEQIKPDGTMAIIKPGDTIGIKGVRGGVQFINIAGTEENPIVITNCDGEARVETDVNQFKALQFINVKHFILSGAGSTSHEYGLKLKGHFGVDITDYSTNFEIFAIEVQEAGYVGIAARTSPPPYPDCVNADNTRDVFTQENTFIHHNYVHDTGGEGMYIGGSHWHILWDEKCPGVYEPELHGVKIYENIVENTGMDAIQVGSASKDVKIHNNIIRNFGVRNIGGHMTGFQINPGTTGKLYNNVIDGGNGFGIFVFGKGDNLIYNNVIIKPTYDGIYTGDRGPTANTGFYIINNTIIEPGKGIGWNSYETSNNEIINNIIYKPKVAFIDSDGHNDNYLYQNNLELSDDEGIEFGENYKLLSGSIKAIDKGKNISDKYKVQVDILGNKRPSGTAYDIGAYEFID